MNLRPDAPTVLLLDDSEIALGTYAAVLQDVGMDVRTASTLMDFDDLLHTSRPSLILCDVMMPDLGGDSVAHILREQYHLSDTPIVLLSALPEAELEQRAARAGADGYIHKSADLDGFAAEVRRLIAAGRAAA